MMIPRILYHELVGTGFREVLDPVLKHLISLLSSMTSRLFLKYRRADLIDDRVWTLLDIASGLHRAQNLHANTSAAPLLSALLLNTDDMEDLERVFQSEYTAPGNARRHVFDHLHDVTRNRCFFTTENGYIGMGPYELRSGGEVWILGGRSHPFILVPINDCPSQYYLVGEAYVDGTMQGEAVSKMRQRLNSLNLDAGLVETFNQDNIWETVNMTEMRKLFNELGKINSRSLCAAEHGDLTGDLTCNEAIEVRYRERKSLSAGET